MTQIFNTSFEISLRVLLTLFVSEKPLSMDLIVAFDLVTTYGKNYGVLEDNLHGENSQSFSESSSRRTLVKESIKNLVLDDYISTRNGFSFSISQRGRELCESMTSDYAIDYKKYSHEVQTYFSQMDESSIIAFVNQGSIKRSKAI